MKDYRAFTLIEMLIVIVIIGILAAALVPRLQDVQGRARDTKRVADIKNLQTALELYHSDYGIYPESVWCSSYSTSPNSGWCNSVQQTGNKRRLANGALSPYIAEDPTPPNPDTLSTIPSNGTTPKGGTYFYLAQSSTFMGCKGSQSYLIVSGMETPSNRQPNVKSCDGIDFSRWTPAYYVLKES